jgi:hypothetical protein
MAIQVSRGHFVKYTLLCLLVLIISIGISAQIEIPYVYYYAETLNAIVVERADGSDSLLLGQGVMPENHNMVVWSEWSHSGQWLAWISGVRESEGGRGYSSPRIWLANADGNTRIDLLDSVTNVVSVSWSSTRDYLLVISHDWADVLTPIYLIEASTGTLVASIDDIYFEYASWRNVWSEDGDNLSFPYLTENREWRYRLLYLDGHTEDIEDSSMIEPRYTPPIEDNDLGDNLVSPDGSKTFIRDSLSIHDNDTNITTELRPFSGAASGGVCAIIWHHRSEWLFFSTNMTWAGGVGAFCGGNLVKADGTIQREIGACNLYNACARWLPERVLPHLAEGQAQSVVPESFLIIPHEGRVMSVGWHPLLNILASYEERGEEYWLHLWQIDRDSATLTASFLVNRCYDWIVWECQLIWNSSGSKIALAGSLHTQILEVETAAILDNQELYFAGWETDDNYILTSTLSDFDKQSNLIVQLTTNYMGLELINPNSDEQIASIYFDDIIMSVAFIPNSEAIVFTFNRQRDVFIWHYRTNRITPINRMGINDLNTNIDGSVVYGYGLFSPVTFWDSQNANLVSRLNRYASAVAFSFSGQYLATASSNVAEIWDAGLFLP